MAGRWPLRCGREQHLACSGSGGRVVTMHQVSVGQARRNEQRAAASANSTMMIINAGG